MNSRRLKLLIGCLALAGTALSMVVLNKSLQPHKKPPKLPFVNIATLAAGQRITVDTEALRYFVVYPLNGELQVLAAPVQEGKVLMPEIHWWKPLLYCQDFDIDVVSGAITKESRFRCRDDQQPVAWMKQWQWDIEGKHIAITGGDKIDNLYRVRFERDDDELRFVGLIAD
jgi:hypothetical protein